MLIEQNSFNCEYLFSKEQLWRAIYTNGRKTMENKDNKNYRIQVKVIDFLCVLTEQNSFWEYLFSREHFFVPSNSYE